MIINYICTLLLAQCVIFIQLSPIILIVGYVFVIIPFFGGFYSLISYLSSARKKLYLFCWLRTYIILLVKSFNVFLI